MKFERILKIENLEKYFNRKDEPVLKNLTFDLLEGEFLGIMGKSGSGKTTILNSVSTIGSFNKGSISYYGKDISLFLKKELISYRRDAISYIYQDYKLIDFMTSLENIIMPLNIAKKQVDKKLIDDLSEILEIKEILDKKPDFLSGGQAQKIAIARALAKDSQIILADEPTSALDSKSMDDVLRLLKTYNKSYKKSIIMASHDLRAISFTDRVIFIRDGKIYNELRRRENEDRRAYLIRIEDADRQLIR